VHEKCGWLASAILGTLAYLFIVIIVMAVSVLIAL